MFDTVTIALIERMFKLHTVSMLHVFNDTVYHFVRGSSGALTFAMWICRYVLFTMQESPKYLVAKGRDADAIKVGLYRHSHPAVSHDC